MITIKAKAISWAKNAVKIKASCKSFKSIKSLHVEKKKSSRFKQDWRDVGDKRIFFRSMWEANFGRYLQWQKENGLIKEWLHEPKTFWFDGIKRGCVSYLPDFKVIFNDGSHEWIEVKGFMDAKSRTKINRFRKYFPEETLRIVSAKWYKENSAKISLLIKDWEKG